MTELRKALQDLRNERERANREVSELAKAIAVLERLSVRDGRSRNGAIGSKGRTSKRKISAAGRARIAAAQRARWAKVRQQKKQVAKAA
jgi:predicted  nucleic acid-binding Zn-ribbon protein